MDTHTDEPTLEQLRKRASALKIDGRTSMERDELVDAIAAAERAAELEAVEAAKQADAEAAAAAVAAAGERPGITVEPLPSSPEVIGRPPLSELAAERAANRNPRVIGAPTQEG